jgi:trans-aconitate methyltransferase
MLTRKGVSAIGIDSSIEMVKKAKYNFPKCKFYNSDVMHANQFQYGVFTHALMLDMTLYYIQDKTAAFHNIHTWLKPNGYMVIHLVNRDQYDPRIFASDPLYKVNPQRFSKKRITQSFVKFDDFQYKGDFIGNNENSTYVETMKEDEGGKAIRNEHVYYMEKQKTIIDKAKGIGFKFIGKINMSVCNHAYEYLYVFQKIK